jgi:hypothetical protein
MEGLKGLQVNRPHARSEKLQTFQTLHWAFVTCTNVFILTRRLRPPNKPPATKSGQHQRRTPWQQATPRYDGGQPRRRPRAPFHPGRPAAKFRIASTPAVPRQDHERMEDTTMSVRDSVVAPGSSRGLQWMDIRAEAGPRMPGVAPHFLERSFWQASAVAQLG